MKNKRLLSITLSLAMMIALLPAVPVEAAVKVSKVSVTSAESGSTKKVVVAKGKSVKLKTVVSVKPDKAANKKVTYKSANKKIATVSNKGVVKGKKAGNTKITVTSKKNKKKKATISVQVKKGAVTGIALDQTAGTINVGEAVTLKATVKAKSGADKTLAWSSSAEAVAKVNDKGVVTAVAPGSAVITAQAIDGSGKKATYAVTVLQPVNLKAMEVQNAQALTFALDNPCALDASKVEVKVRAFSTGTFNKKLTIDTLTTTDNINYSLVVNSQSRMSVGDFVQVSVPSLTGSAKTIEVQYLDPIVTFTGDDVSYWKQNEYSTATFRFEEELGYSSYELTGLPVGLSYEDKNGVVKVKGVPTAVGVTNATMTAKDELGNTLTKTIKFAVYSDDVMVGALPDYYALAATTDSNNISVSVDGVYGGKKSTYYYSASSTSCYYQILDDGGTGVGFNSSDAVYDYNNKDEKGNYVKRTLGGKPYYDASYIYGCIKAPKDYTIKIKAYNRTDVDNYISNPEKYPESTIKSCEYTKTIHVVQGVTIAGIVKDAVGNPIPNAKVEFINKNRADKYTPYFTDSSDSDEKHVGAYSAVLSPGNYDIEASYGDSYNYYDDDGDQNTFSGNDSDNAKATNYLYSQSLTETKSGFDISLNLYQATLVSGDDDIKNAISGCTWMVDHQTVGRGKTVYLKPGTYKLECERTNRLSESTTDQNGTVTYKYYKVTKKYTADVSISNAATQSSVNVTEDKKEITQEEYSRYYY